MTIRVRALSDEEMNGPTQLARLRKRDTGLVRRAQIILHAVEGSAAPEIAVRPNWTFPSPAGHWTAWSRT